MYLCGIKNLDLEPGLWFTDLAVLAGVSVRTGAVILVRLRVHARPPVLTGPVGPAVVQICTENTGETHSFYHIFFGGGVGTTREEIGLAVLIL